LARFYAFLSTRIKQINTFIFKHYEWSAKTQIHRSIQTKNIHDRLSNQGNLDGYNLLWPPRRAIRRETILSAATTYIFATVNFIYLFFIEI